MARLIRRRNYSTPRRNEFAELLSQDLSRDEIMQQMNLTSAGYRKHMRDVRADLGWQAVWDLYT